MSWNTTLSLSEIRKAKKAYYLQAASCCDRVDRNGDPIDMLLSFNEWMDIWWRSGKWFERGNKPYQYVMSRCDDIGHYSAENVVIKTALENHRESGEQKSVAMTRVWAGDEHKKKRCKPCSFGDGVIYPSIAALVRSRQGQRSKRPGKIQYHTWDEYERSKSE